jgi:hypothetical protein
MRAFYRLPLQVLEGVLPSLTEIAGGVVLSSTASTAWLLAEVDPSLVLEVLGAVRLGARLSELDPGDRAACENPDQPGVPRTIFAGDALEDYT